jgi:hypothetical protein
VFPGLLSPVHPKDLQWGRNVSGASVASSGAHLSRISGLWGICLTQVATMGCGRACRSRASGLRAGGLYGPSRVVRRRAPQNNATLPAGAPARGSSANGGPGLRTRLRASVRHQPQDVGVT